MTEAAKLIYTQKAAGLISLLPEERFSCGELVKELQNKM